MCFYHILAIMVLYCSRNKMIVYKVYCISLPLTWKKKKKVPLLLVTKKIYGDGELDFRKKTKLTFNLVVRSVLIS